MAKETHFEDPPLGHVAKLGYDSVNDRWQAEAVDASGLAQVDVADVADRQVNAHGYDGSTWRKLNLLWGYYDRWVENLGATATEAQYSQASTPVPAGYVYVAQIISARNVTNAMTTCHIRLNIGAVQLYPKSVTSLAQWIPIAHVGEVILKEGDTVQVVLNGCAVDDEIQAGVCGYKMRINQ